MSYLLFLNLNGNLNVSHMQIILINNIVNNFIKFSIPFAPGNVKLIQVFF